jgi:hypothetical protein
VKTLPYFYGGSGNDTTETEQMYVGLESDFGSYGEYRYGDRWSCR